MPSAIDLLHQGNSEELWKRYCGFLSLDIDGFMDVQKRLLLEQLNLLNNCGLGEKLFNGEKPESVEEFRRIAPLTTYKDYCPELLEKHEDILPAKAVEWVHTSGRSGEYPFKWVPMTDAFRRELSVIMYAIGLISVCDDWKQTDRMSDNLKIVYGVAPRPYVSGAMARMLELQTPVEYYPPIEESEALSFEERIAEGFKLALNHGLEYFFGLSLVLVAVGEKFSHASRNTKVLPLLSQPKALFRLIRAMIRSKREGRSMLPRDIWDPRGIIGSGVDSGIYKERIKDLWGRYPLDLYGCTEGTVIGTQTWDYDGMTLIPSLNFLEFIPEEENLKWEMDHSYKQKTVLLDEVEPGKDYEIVFTNLHGGALVRYRVKDIVRFTSLRNDKLGIELPQMVFVRRADDLLDFVVVRLTEKTIWQAIENTAIPYVDWTAYKEPGKPVLKLYIEPKDGCASLAADIAAAVYDQIMGGESDELDADSPLRDDFASTIEFSVDVTLLPRGAFSAYTARKQAEGADIAHLKPPHINPSEPILAAIVNHREEAEEAEANKIPA